MSSFQRVLWKQRLQWSWVPVSLWASMELGTEGVSMELALERCPDAKKYMYMYNSRN